MRRRHVLQSAAASVASLAVPSFAQSWPARPIKLVVPFPAGSSPDLIARLIAEPLGQALAQTIVIDNRPGAGGNLGTGVVAKAEPDGYTLLFTIQGPLVTAPLLSKSLNYDPLKELAPVALRALGVTTLGRAASLPELPTFAEQGYPGFEAISWQAVLAPAKTPKPIVERVSRELVRIIKSDEVRSKMLGQYFSAAGTAPEGLAGLMVSERDRWAKVITAAGVPAEG